jgi:hypothetical protein
MITRERGAWGALKLASLLMIAAAMATGACGGDDKPSEGPTGDGDEGDGDDGDGDGDSVQCDEDACLECVMGSDPASCVTKTCAGCDDETSAGDGDGDGDDDSVPKKECRKDDDCGISFECVSCVLTDTEGWCKQTEACKYDTDCDIGESCGYNVESGMYRCLPAKYCE